MARQAKATSLIEDGTAARYFVRDLDRFEVSDGLFTFVCTTPVTLGRDRCAKVDLYLECTGPVISKGISMVFRKAPHLIRAYGMLPKLFGAQVGRHPH